MVLVAGGRHAYSTTSKPLASDSSLQQRDKNKNVLIMAVWVGRSYIAKPSDKQIVCGASYSNWYCNP